MKKQLTSLCVSGLGVASGFPASHVLADNARAQDNHPDLRYYDGAESDEWQKPGLTYFAFKRLGGRGHNNLLIHAHPNLPYDGGYKRASNEKQDGKSDDALVSEWHESPSTSGRALALLRQ
jgi:hypothetical protein